MSMISAQIDELREMADDIESRYGYPTAVKALRYAADTIWQLRDDLQRANAENAKLREQMERLVTLLRVDCDIDASWDGLRRFWSIGLTENGCLMRDRACKAEVENAKLRERIHELEMEGSDHFYRTAYAEDANRTLEAENVKLRELVDALRYCAHEAHGICARVPVGGEKPFMCCPLYDFDTKEYRCKKLMRELGIEVEE